MRVALYGRYSSDQQNKTSVHDQFALCRERCARESWKPVGAYGDEAVSGASLIRPGIQRLIADANAGKFDMVLAEALDRISRDQEDVAGFYKQMQFLGIPIFTIAEGEITALHIGLKGTMNAIFLKDLAQKTHRGLRSVVENGKSGGGLTYGYDVVKKVTTGGEPVRGDRTINEQQATIVRRIFEEYLRGDSPRTICGRLNKEGVVSPSGGEWGASTVYGNRQRGTGILNNDLYQGKLVWNRLRYVKDPKTGKRISRLNDASEHVTVDVPDLRIVDQETWDRVKRLQGQINNPSTPLRDKMRPRTLFSGLMKCGCCGAGYTVVGRSRVGCAAAREKLSCDNRLTINIADIEVAVINALQTHLMDDELCKEFCREYTRRMNELRKQHNASVTGYRAEAAKVERERQQIIKSITDGVPTELIRDRAIAIQKRREELETLLAEVKEEPVLFHPNMAQRYHAEIADLVVTLRDPDRRGHAANLLRSLVDRIILTPVASEKRYEIDLVGDLAGILSIATGADNAVVAAELSKFEPVEDGLESTAGLVATEEDKQATANPPRLLAMVAGGRLSHELSVSDYQPSANAEKWKTPPERGFHKQFEMVAGTGFEPVTFRL